MYTSEHMLAIASKTATPCHYSDRAERKPDGEMIDTSCCRVMGTAVPYAPP
jgi:hypothetical protein